MSRLLDKNICNNKSELLDYYRNRAKELLAEIKQTYAESEYKKRATAVNDGIGEAKETLLRTLKQMAKKEDWMPQELLEAILMVTYANYIVMMESRNSVWSYEYMAFARRIGELWESFCQLCWEYPIKKDINYFIPPLFKDVRE